ncbi:MAG: PAS domain-containing sensor histidine kinase, partial [Chitinophagaceae bacterium]
MMGQTRTYEDLIQEVASLRNQLQEATDAIDAIRTGQVDALFVQNGESHQIYTLKSADQTYRAFIEKMKEGAVTLDKNDIILYSNSQFASMIGLPLSDIIGANFRTFVPAESVAYVNSIFEKGWKSDSKGEISLVNQQHFAIPFLVSVAALEFEEGEALSVILTDLSFQKETERQLTENNNHLEEARRQTALVNEKLESLVKERTRDLFLSREHFKFLADNIPVIVWTTKADGQVDYFNKLWYDYTGLNSDQSKGFGFNNVIHRDDLDRVSEAWQTAILNKRTFQFEYRIRRRSDRVFRWFLSKAEPVPDENGKIIAWFGISIDIEEQKKELQKKDDFISMASHELKTPLASLKGYVQLIDRHDNLPAPVNKYVSKANESINKLQHLINNLLDVSKIEAGKLKFNTEVFNLADCVHSCVEDCMHMYPAFKLTTEVDPVLPVVGNCERLEQVLMNLISNAVKYSNGRKEIIVRAHKTDHHVVVSVTDFGLGLAEEDKKKVFERFYRVNTNSFAPGLGMGLYISSEIIKEHFGKLEIDSQLEQGSTFSFSLPLI